MSEDPIILSKEQALSMLGDEEHIHTFRNTGFALFGCDWKRESIIEAINENECEIGGPACQHMNHGLAIHVGDSPLFVKCKIGFDYAAFEASISGKGGGSGGSDRA